MRLSTGLVLCVLGILSLLWSGEADMSQDWAKFEDFNVRFSKSHSSASEKLYRFKVFQESLGRQEKLNELEAVSGGTAVYGVNKFSDLTQEEFKSLYLSGITSSPLKHSNSAKLVRGNVIDTPATFDWRDAGVIGGIRNQQRCGSCWAFAIVETIESAFAIQNRSKLSLILSSQQLISCDYDPNRSLSGCKGGNIKEAFLTVEQQGMILVKQSDYPFASGNGETYPCKANLPNTGLKLQGFNYTEKLPEDAMKSLLVSYSPLTTSINAVSWQDYIRGIIQHHCTSLSIDHAVQVVGYNMTSDVPYWIVRNTWGPDWGEGGYVRVKFGENMCGIADEVAAVTKVVRV